MAESASVRVRADLDSRPAEKALSRFVKKAESVDVRLSLKEKNFTQPLGRITGAADEFNKSLAASNARVIAFAASAGLMYSVQRALVSVTKSAIEVEASLADINVILGASSSNLAKFGDQLFKIAGQTGQAFQTVTTAATELARQGLSMEETLRRTKDAMILTRLAGMDAASAVDALTASINSFNKAAITSTEIVNKMATVDAAFAVSTTDLAEALKRVGSSAIDAGVGFDQLMAMTTSVQQITARGGAVIGNSLKSIFTRIQRTEVLDQLQQLGIAVRDMKGNTLPAIQIMTQLSKVIDTLSSAQRANITELMGGVFQINVVKAALGDLGKEYSIYENALKTSTDATDAATKRNEKLNQTLSALVNKTFQNVTKAGAAIGKLTIAPALEGVLDKVNTALEKFDPKDSESTGNRIGKGILEGIGNFIKGPGLIIGLAVVGKLLQNFGRFASDSFKEFFNVNEAAKKRLAMEKFINQELAQNSDLTKAILAGEISVGDAEKVILRQLEARVLQQEKLNRLIKEASIGMSRRGAYASMVDEGSGTYAVKPPKKYKGNVPNFSKGDIASLVKDELSSASYANSGTKAVIDTLPGLGLHVRNTEESVSYAPGMKAPFINPPIDSPEGRKHRDKAIKQTGIDPYESSSSSGLPGFAKKGKRSKPKTKTLRSSNQSKGVLLPEFGRNDSNLTFEASLSKVYPSPGSKKRKQWSDKGFTDFKMTGVKASRLREKSSSSFDSLLDSNFDPAIQGLGASIVGSNKGKLPKKTTGKFSDYFDKKAWPQVKGRLFEAALNYVAVNMSAKAQMSGKLDDIKALTGGETWDFPDIKNQLASLYKINTGGNWDAKPNVDAGTQASIIKKTLNTKYKGKTVPSQSTGFIPNFAEARGKSVLGVSTMEARAGVERFRTGEVSQAQGLVSQINASRAMSASEKNTLKKEIDQIRRKKKNSKNPKGITIDGTDLGSMLVPRVGSSKGAGKAKPKIDKDNTLLRQYLSKHYQNKTGLDFNKLPEKAKKKVVNSTKASFPVLGPSKGNNVNIVDDVATAIEKETRSFVASMKGGSAAKKANVLQNLSTHQSSISSAAGAVFESGVKSAFDLEIGKTNDRFDVSTSQGLKEAFPITTPYGEFKIDDNSPLRQDMAAKVLRQKMQMGIASGGFIPGFSEKDTNRARESRQAGVPYSQTYLSFVDTSKYAGPVVGNRKDEPTYQALIKAVRSHPDPKNAGMHAGGFIPNFTPEGGAPGDLSNPYPALPDLPELTGNADEIKGQLQEYQNHVIDIRDAWGEAIPEAADIAKEIDAIIQGMKDAKEKAGGAAASAETLGPEITSLENEIAKKDEEAFEHAKTRSDLKDLGNDQESKIESMTTEYNQLLDKDSELQDKIRATEDEAVRLQQEKLANLEASLSGAQVSQTGTEQDVRRSTNRQAPMGQTELDRFMGQGHQSGKAVDGKRFGAKSNTGDRKWRDAQTVLTQRSDRGGRGGSGFDISRQGPRDKLSEGLAVAKNKALQGQVEGAKETKANFLAEAKAGGARQVDLKVLEQMLDAQIEEGTKIRNLGKQRLELAQKEVDKRRNELRRAEEMPIQPKPGIGKDRVRLKGNDRKLEEIMPQLNVEAQTLDSINDQATAAETTARLMEEDTQALRKTLEEKKTAQNEALGAIDDEVTIREKANKRLQKSKENADKMEREASSKSEKLKGKKYGAWSGFKQMFGMDSDVNELKTAAGDKQKARGMGFKSSGEADALAQDAKSQAGDALTNKAMLASMALPMITGAFASKFDDDSESGAKNKAIAEGAGNIGSMAAMGAMFGPWGALGGVVIGAATAGLDVWNKLQDKTHEFNAAAEKAAGSLTKFNNASQSYLKSLTEFNELLTSETGELDAAKAEKFRKKLSEALLNIPREYRTQLGKAQGNVERIQEIFAEIQADLQRSANVKAAQAELAETIEEKIPKEKGRMFEGKGSQKDQDNVFEMIKSTLDLTKFYGDEGKELSKKIRSASGRIASDFDGFKKVLKEAGADAKTIELMEDMFKGSKHNLIALSDEFEDFAFDAGDASKSGEKLTSSIIDYRNKMEALRTEQERWNVVMDESKNQVKRLASVLLDRLKFIDNMRNQRSAHGRSMGMAEIKGRQQVAQPFIDNLQKTGLGASVQKMEMESKQTNALQKLHSSIKTNLIGTINSKFEKLTSTTERATESTSKENNVVNSELTKQTKTMEAYQKALIESVSLGADGKSTFEDIATGIDAIIPAAGLTEAAELALRDDLTAVIEKGNHDLALMSDAHKNELEIQKLNAQYQKEVAINTKQIGQLGGIGGMMGGGNDFSKINKAFENAAVSAFRSNSKQEGGRASLNILDLLRNFAGTSGASLPASMRQDAVDSVKSNLETKVNRIRNGMEGTGQMTPELQAELSELSNNLDEIAETKVAAQLKDVPTHLQGIADKIRDLTDKTMNDSSMTAAVQNALEKVMGGSSSHIVDPLKRIEGIMNFQRGVKEIQKAQNNVADALKAQQGTGAEIGVHVDALHKEALALAKTIPDSLLKASTGVDLQGLQNLRDNSGKGYSQDAKGLAEQKKALLKLQSIMKTLDGTITREEVRDDDAIWTDLVSQRTDSKTVGGSDLRIASQGQGRGLYEGIKTIRANQLEFEKGMDDGSIMPGEMGAGGGSGRSIARGRTRHGFGPESVIAQTIRSQLSPHSEFGFERGARQNRPQGNHPGTIVETLVQKIIDATVADKELSGPDLIKLLREADKEMVGQGYTSMAEGQTAVGNLNNERKFVNAALMAIAQYAEQQSGKENYTGTAKQVLARREAVAQEGSNNLLNRYQGLQQPEGQLAAGESRWRGTAPGVAALTAPNGLLDVQLEKSGDVEAAKAEMARLIKELTRTGNSASVGALKDSHTADIRDRKNQILSKLTSLGMGDASKRQGAYDNLTSGMTQAEIAKTVGVKEKGNEEALEVLQKQIREQEAQQIILTEITRILNGKKAAESKALKASQDKATAEMKANRTQQTDKVSMAMELKTAPASKAFNRALGNLTWKEMEGLEKQYGGAEGDIARQTGGYETKTEESALGKDILKGSVEREERLREKMAERGRQAQGRTQNLYGDEIFGYDKAMVRAGLSEKYKNEMLPPSADGKGNDFRNAKIDDPFQILNKGKDAFLDDGGVIEKIVDRYSTIGTGAQDAKGLVQDVAGKVIKKRMEALELFNNSDLSISQYLVKLSEAELEIFRADANAGRISESEYAGHIKAQMDKALATGLPVDELAANFLHSSMSRNSKDSDSLARSVSESMASGLTTHNDGSIFGAQMVQDKGKEIVSRVNSLGLGNKQTTAYSIALGEFATFEMNFAQGMGGKAQLLAALNTKLQSALENTKGSQDEIKAAYDAYIISLATGLKPQDIIMERKGIMDSTGKRVARDQVPALDASVKKIVEKYEGQAKRGEITEEGRTVLQNAESALEATMLAEKKHLVSTAAMTAARKNYLDALTKNSADSVATKEAYDSYAASVAAGYKSQDLMSISAGTVGQFGQEMMGADAASFGGVSSALTDKYNKAFGKGQIAKAAVPRLAKAEAALKAAESKAKAGVLSAEQLTGAYLKFLNTLNSETNKISEVQAAYEKYTASLGEKKGRKDLITSRTKVLEATRKGTTRGGQAGLVKEVESITKANQRLFNRGKLTGESLEALNKAEAQYHNAQTNWANGLSSTAALMAAASKNLQEAVATGNTGKIKKALNGYIEKLDTELKPQDYLERAGKFIEKNQNKVGKGNRVDFGKDLKKISNKYQKSVDKGLLTEQDGQIISQALADYGAAQKNFKDGLISQSQLLKSAEGQLSKISGTSGSAEIKKAMKDYMSAATKPIDALSTLQETGKDLGSLGGGILGKDLGKFKKQLQGINQSYNESVNNGTLTRKNAKILKKAAKEFTLSEYEFGKGMRGSADRISAAKSQLEAHLKVGSEKTEESLKAYLKAIDAATTPLDREQFKTGQITKFAGQLTKRERKRFRRSLEGQDFTDISNNKKLSRKEKRDLSVALGVARKLESENAPAEELRKAWDDYYRISRRAFQTEAEFLESLKKSFELRGTKQVSDVMDSTRRGIVDQSRGDFSNLEEAQGFNRSLVKYQSELKTIAQQRGTSENDLKDALQAEAEYQKMIIAFNKGKMGSRDRMAGADAALKAKRAAGVDTGDAFMEALQARFSYGQNEAVHAVEDMVISMVDTFESELNSALFNAISGAKDAKEAFKDMADVMLNEITKMSIQATTRAIMGNIPGLDGAKTGGLITGGSGIRDDVPMLLQGGEFVIKKSSVDKFGPGLFRSLNDQSAAKLSEGGSVQLVNSYGMPSSGIEDKDPNLRQVAGVDVRPIADPQGGLSSISDSEGGGSGFTLRNAFVLNDDKRPTGGVLEVDSRLSRRALMNPDNPRNKVRMDKEKVLADYTLQKIQDMKNSEEEYQEYLDKKKSRWRMAGANIAMQLGLNYAKNGSRGGGSGNSWFSNWGNNDKDALPRAQGGPIPFENGGLNSDKVPAMLTAGEYIMSREAVQKYGIDTMRKLNVGQVGGYANGGLINEGGLSNGGAGDLSGSIGGTNNVNITVNVDNTGKTDSQLSSQGGASSQSEDSKNMARQIESAVVGVLLKQQKQGGVLKGTR